MVDASGEEELPSIYQVSFPVGYFHASPRFGHTNSLAGVITGSERSNDYVQGTLFAAAFILFLFMVWVIYLVIFMCRGERFGILAGRRLPDKSPCKNSIYRVTIMLLCLSTTLAGITFLVVAGDRTDKTFDIVRIGVANVADKGAEVTSIADKAIKAGDEIIPIRDLVMRLVDKGICNSFDGGNGMNIPFDPINNETKAAVSSLSNFTMSDLTNMRNNFSSEFTKYEKEVLEVVDVAEEYINISFYAIVVTIFAFFLAAGTYMSWFGPQNRCYFVIQTWFVVPFFFVFLVLSAIAASAIASGLVVNSDACIGGDDGTPEGFIKSIIDTQTDGINPYAREVVDHYIINGCQGDFDGHDTVQNLKTDMKDAMDALAGLQSMIDSEIETLEIICGGDPGSLDPVSEALGKIQSTIMNFTSIIDEALSLVECKPINDIYTDFFHDGVCGNLPQALYAMFVSIVMVLVSGMGIFTLRGALLPNLKEVVEEGEYVPYTYSRRWNRSNHIRDDVDLEENTEMQSLQGSRTSAM